MRTESMINELEGKLTAEEMEGVNGGLAVPPLAPMFIDPDGIPLQIFEELKWTYLLCPLLFFVIVPVNQIFDVNETI